MTITDAPAPDAALPVTEFDELLVSHPFGDSDYLTGQLAAAFRRRLLSLAYRLPLANDVLDALDAATPYARYRMVGDTVFRCAVQHLQVQLLDGGRYGLDGGLARQILRAAVDRLATGGIGLLDAQLGDRIGPEPYHGWIWHEDGRNTPVTQAFHDIVRDHYGLALCTPTENEIALLIQATRLLETVLPRVARSALTHTHLVAIFRPTGRWESTRSSSEFKVSGTIFLNRRTLTNVWTVAEHLLHESLHQQLYDIRQTHSLLVPNAARSDAPLIHSLWNAPDRGGGNKWDTHRALAAFHVYIHLTLFARAAASSGAFAAQFGPVRMLGPQTAIARAQYLGEQLRQRGWPELGRAGHTLVEWLDSIRPALMPPLVTGSFVHLLLDRYWREAATVAAAAARGEPDDDGLLDALITREIESVRTILTTIDGDVRGFDEALETSADTPAERFTTTRAVIAETLIRACPRRYELALTREPDELVRSMVELSSEQLRVYLGR
ncbi:MULTISPECIES: HEXXH motif-containing putative peptide modification protein [unclassified Nocardia]|uniref:aKG-HExxH-type peptide beta-hydroxylase n=1 Tax=unclassified Nocardia TaxID=2637762 RepID=UPI001CE44AF1|nr:MULTISPECIES: HEXXH motif-containing putative peptide modification protein [unclassified Nocardia]